MGSIRQHGVTPVTTPQVGGWLPCRLLEGSGRACLRIYSVLDPFLAPHLLPIVFVLRAAQATYLGEVTMWCAARERKVMGTSRKRKQVEFHRQLNIYEKLIAENRQFHLAASGW